MSPWVLLAAAVACALPGPVRAQDAAAGEKAFIVCRACHQVGPGARASTGPALNGVLGRKAGIAPGFAYSAVLKESGVTWDEPTLVTFIASPQTMVKGTKMIFAGIKDQAKVKDVIAFLGQYKDDGTKAP